MIEVGYSSEDRSNIWNDVDLGHPLSNITEQSGTWMTVNYNVVALSLLPV